MPLVPGSSMSVCSMSSDSLARLLQLGPSSSKPNDDASGTGAAAAGFEPGPCLPVADTTTEANRGLS
eukprot:CAMPEP_0202905164 /NCGR_PEP_ID=MMETSP1392-20130828/32911_1 /ASSEMBLY_ACC=CAM_ASM_000868 /TAXON_ID=225041 /ORGANISM="Chlamydomonas chlamydogama, Strain SAG 11-48b" /LENGTH=66 /DNA_ID=CAMNT_0049593135 /DNA_START=285 /DNA_END=482 /DNA_ORIENTATION=+